MLVIVLLELVLGVCCNNLIKKMMKMTMMKRALKFQRLLYILIVGKRLLHLKPEKFNGYACKLKSYGVATLTFRFDSPPPITVYSNPLHDTMSSLTCIAQSHQAYLLKVFYRFMVPTIHSCIRELMDDLE